MARSSVSHGGLRDSSTSGLWTAAYKPRHRLGRGGDGGVSTAQPLELHPLGPRVKVDALWLGSLPSLGIS